MMSWISEWANKAEHLLNTLDSSAAGAFNAHRNRNPPSVFDNSASARSALPEVVRDLEFDSANACQPAGDPSTDIGSQSMRNHGASKLRSSPKLKTLGNTTGTLSLLESTHAGYEETATSSGYETVDSSRLSAFDEVNQGCPPILVTESDNQFLPPFKANLAQETAMDTKLENKLLRSEVSSLSQEISDLLKRNHKVVEENKELRGQVERLASQLRDSDARVRELQVKVKELLLDSSALSTRDERVTQLEQQLATTQTDLLTARGHLESSRERTKTIEYSLQESRRQNEIAEKRAELAQKESSRLVKELAQYKEKAAHILTMKENLIASLRAAESNPSETSDVDREMIKSLQAECDMLREEVSRWRIEADHRELSMQELEIQMQSERESLRRDLDLAEQHAQREKQLREDADSELVQLKRQLREYEDNTSRQKADWHAQLTASETEVGRLRQAMARRHPSGSSQFLANSSPTESTQTDTAHVLSLELRLRQLSDNLLTKQDALDSVLAQNHALKIRLERAQSDNESLVSTLSTQGYSPPDIHVPLPYHVSGNYGWARLTLHNSPIPRSLRPIPRLLDDVGIRITNILRRWPLVRLSFFVYIAFLHAWLSWAFLFYLPSN